MVPKKQNKKIENFFSFKQKKKKKKKKELPNKKKCCFLQDMEQTTTISLIWDCFYLFIYLFIYFPLSQAHTIIATIAFGSKIGYSLLLCCKKIQHKSTKAGHA